MGELVNLREEEAIEAEAWQWLIRLDGDVPLSEAEVTELHEWSRRSPAHLAKLKGISGFWNDANRLTQLEVPLRPRRTGVLGVRLAAVAAVVGVIAVGITSWWWLKAPADRNGSYSTLIGQQKTLRLVDGSTVQINTDSQLRVDYGNTLRKIELLRGEAFFSVAPNPSKPFEVDAGGGVVRAVGTAFAVHLQKDNLDVTVTDGRVNVASKETPAITALKAGETATFSKLSASEPVSLPAAEELSPPELQRRLAWHEGYWVFTGQPLDAVINELNRYSAVTLQIGDPRLAKLAVGGRFKVGDLDAFYDVLQNNFGIYSVRIDDRHIELRSTPPH